MIYIVFAHPYPSRSRANRALLDAVRARALQILDGSIEGDKGANPFLHGVPAILEALRSGKIICKVYKERKFHAKAYITYARLEVVGATALVGSSNFTYPGLNDNIECGFAKIYSWPTSPNDLRQWIHDAFQRRKSCLPTNRRDSFSNNRTEAQTHWRD